MPHVEKTLELSSLPEKKAAQLLAEHNIGLTVDEAKKVSKLLGRNPTLTEATIWGIQGSEHSSYKSSRKHLSMLPTRGPNVILGPSEDAGIVEIAKEGDKRFGVVVSHESHNHPSQVVPYEGAATGVGGCVRDVLCMGAHVIATADSLRFGDISKNQSKLVAAGVIDGVGGYGNPIGVPNIAGDTYFNDTFNDNCLVNVVTLGLLAEDEIIHSYAPKGAGEKGYEIILVGKPTDMSGMGGAAFASIQLNDSEKEKNKGAVQEPNPFLKRHIIQSTYDLFQVLKDKGLTEKVGFKDLGAGGIMCSTVEMAAHSGYGAEIDLKKVPVAVEGLPPHVIACAETQERMCWMVPKELTKMVLAHYNEKWALPKISKGARAAVIGKVTKGEKYILTFDGTRVCDARATDITAGLLYNRPFKEKKKVLREPKIAVPRDLKDTLLKLLSHENIACKMPIFESFDKNVQGITVLEPGDADAGVIAPFRNRDDVTDETKKIGVALSTDANPFYGQLSPYWQAANAVVEGARNVAAVGATPWCITDCLNYGNPEKPDQMWEFVEGVRGVADALKGVGLKGFEMQPEEPLKKKRGRQPKIKADAPKGPPPPLPCISGNVSLYNTSQRGEIAPQALIATLGRIENVEKICTPGIKAAGNELYLIGPRKDELGGSTYYNMLGHLGANVPMPNFAIVRNEIYSLIDMIEAGVVESCHDISDGGLAVALAEMCVGGRQTSSGTTNKVGAKIVISTIDERPMDKHLLTKKGKMEAKKIKPLRTDTKLFSETGGFVLEIKRSNVRRARQIALMLGVPLIKLGDTTNSPKFIVFDAGKEVINLKLSTMRQAWTEGLRKKLK